MKDPLYEQKVRARIIFNRALEEALEEAEPVLKAFAESTIKFVSLGGPSALARFQRPEDPAEDQRMQEILAEAQQKKETK
jgi:hypothetical protein